MKLQRLLALAALATAAPVYGAPSFFDEAQAVLGTHRNTFKGLASQYLSEAKQAILQGKKEMETWYHDGKEFIRQNNLLYELVRHPAFLRYTLRVTEPELCDRSVKQLSGYFDVAEDKHLFFWFFESRNAPADAPLILWLNGGPGCSSSAGLLFELGPCSIRDDGLNVTRNPHSWNSHANVIFLDQPVNVGFSYADGSTTVNSSPVAGKDVYAFLELFLNRYPQYSTQPFHIAAESYGGTYAPNFASIIHRENKALQVRPDSSIKHINLASVVLANGLTDPYIQYASIPDYVCDGPYAIFEPNDPQCQALRAKVPTCQRLLQSCYKYNSRFTCLPAILYCNSQLMAPIAQSGRNPYDARIPCDRSKDGDLCYRQMGWVETWMNNPKVKATLGVNPNLQFTSCNMEVNQAFTGNGDGAHNSAALLPELVNDGVRLLVYAGDADMMCNFIGNERWVDALETKFSDDFRKSKALPWIPLSTGEVAGTVRSSGTGFTAGNVTFVRVHEAGHMVPYDQPEAALDLISRWIMDVPLYIDDLTWEASVIPNL